MLILSGKFELETKVLGYLFVQKILSQRQIFFFLLEEIRPSPAVTKPYKRKKGKEFKHCRKKGNISHLPPQIKGISSSAKSIPSSISILPNKKLSHTVKF